MAKYGATRQCDQMTRSLCQILPIYNNENVFISTLNLQKQVENFANY